MRDSAAENIAKSQAYSQKWYEENCKPAKEYKEGDFVVIRNVDTSVGQNKKFLPRFRGPYVVKKKLPNDRYALQDIENCQITQIPYHGIVEARHMKLWKISTDPLYSQSNTNNNPNSDLPSKPVNH